VYQLSLLIRHVVQLWRPAGIAPISTCFAPFSLAFAGIIYGLAKRLGHKLIVAPKCAHCRLSTRIDRMEANLIENCQHWRTERQTEGQTDITRTRRLQCRAKVKYGPPANCNMPMIIAPTLHIRRVVGPYGFIFAIKCNQFFEKANGEWSGQQPTANSFYSLSVNQYRISFTNNKAAEIVFTTAFLFRLHLPL